jgi:MFS transporter, PAT family, beta-lactamase induction signal transducer AmpG
MGMGQSTGTSYLHLSDYRVRNLSLGWYQYLHNRRLATMLLLGFASGLPLALTAGTLQAWLTVEGLDLHTIGLFAIAGMPYSAKFLWSPAIDRYAPPLLGRRRGWMLLMQIGLLFGIAGLHVLARFGIPALLFGALLIAALSATQDIAFDAYRADVLRPAERGPGAALSVAGYRIGMLTSGAVALVLSGPLGWRDTYLLMAGLMSLGMLATVLAPEPEFAVSVPASLWRAMVDPLREFFGRSGAWSILALVVCYKLGDALAGSLNISFLIRELGFSAAEVGAINKGVGLVSLLVGAFAGGGLLTRLGMPRALLLCGILQALTNFGFVVMAMLGKNYLAMVLAVSLENFAGGMGTAAFVGLLMSLCDHRYTATQFALLSAASALGRVVLAPGVGYVVEALGWVNFFILTIVIALPGLLLIVYLSSDLERLGAVAEVQSATPST